MNVAEIRQAFLAFFERQGHRVVASSPLVPGNDKTLLFTNAGMVQFKDVFLGEEKRDYTRAVTSQKCVRAGGKHNDLDNVGYTARHHTFFEMLGNFSFGDYSKREAIQFAWNFLTEVLKLPQEKLWVTVYKDDKEAEEIWFNELGIDQSRFSRCGEKDNFWSMGDTGPCGPCSEIFYDHGKNIAGGPPGSPDEDGDRYVEIWNLVFMQYNRDVDGNLTPLPKPSVDTGMGLERIAAVMQGVTSNYDTDLFKTLIDSIHQRVPKVDKNNPSLKVIADHIRASAFLIIDGVLPSNEGRGYVLRRIIRRALRHGQKIGFELPFFYDITDTLSRLMAEAYPDLDKQLAHIKAVLKDEELQFSKTLTNGLKHLEEDLESLQGQVISGETVFKLYDTFGFPIDLTADIARERQLTIDEEGFVRLMKERQEDSRKAQSFKAEAAEINTDLRSEFIGYEQLSSDGSVLGLYKDGVEVNEIKAGDRALVVLDKTPFYAESGGQVGDKGTMSSKESTLLVTDTQKLKEAIVHFVLVEEGSLVVSTPVKASVNAKERQKTRCNHSATHLLHAALKDVLGEQVQQKGSLVDAERARFDFSHRHALTHDELKQVETLINREIRANHPVSTELMSVEEAMKSGALALFGEKYSQKVRVLTMGSFSKELCGGTHVARTGDIGFCKLVSEEASASGIRRIEMITGELAVSKAQSMEEELASLASLVKGSPKELIAKTKALIENLKAAQKEIDRLKAKASQQSSDDFLNEVIEINGFQLLAKTIENVDANQLRAMSDKLRSKLAKGVIVLVGINDGKMAVIASLGKEAQARGLQASSFVKHLCGRGGGRPDLAQGGGKVTAELKTQLASLKDLLEE